MAKKSFEIDDKILIELNGGRSITCDFIRKGSDGFVVKNSQEAGSEKIATHNQTFYNTEIKKVRLLHRAQPPAADDAVPSTSQQHVSGNNNNNNAAEASKNVQRTVIDCTVTKKVFSTNEIKEIQERMKNTVYISQHDDKYHNAIREIMEQEIIAIHSEGKFGRLDVKRPVLTICTTTNVYIFDMLRLGAMKKEMKEIMTSDKPRKVAHSSSTLADYLQNKENCTLNNVFDTLVRRLEVFDKKLKNAFFLYQMILIQNVVSLMQSISVFILSQLVDFNLKKSHEYIDIKECYTKYFELPDDFVLQDVSDICANVAFFSPSHLLCR